MADVDFDLGMGEANPALKLSKPDEQMERLYSVHPTDAAAPFFSGSKKGEKRELLSESAYEAIEIT